MQTLLASSRLIRNGYPVVCFTSLGLFQALASRVYRAHLRRWDFEPYGICIARCCLEQRGARPVVYGDDQTWQRLSDRERPFFQAIGSTTDVDWRGESEWRCVGDLDMRQLSPRQAFVFVPSADAKQSLALISRWPIIEVEPANLTDHKT